MSNSDHEISLTLPYFIPENQRFSDIFRGYRKRPVAWNGLIMVLGKCSNDDDNNGAMLKIYHESQIPVTKGSIELWSSHIQKQLSNSLHQKVQQVTRIRKPDLDRLRQRNSPN